MAVGQVHYDKAIILVHYDAFLHGVLNFCGWRNNWGAAVKRVSPPLPIRLSAKWRIACTSRRFRLKKLAVLRLLPGELSALGIDELEYEFYRRLLLYRHFS
ncbi:MAG: Protein ViaA [Sodalis sp.]|nr:MAG: Protein ViaA [Sodalis sp.]